MYVVFVVSLGIGFVHWLEMRFIYDKSFEIRFICEKSFEIRFICEKSFQLYVRTVLKCEFVMTEFDCHDVTLCSWQDVKIQSLSHELTAGSSQRGRCSTTHCWCCSQSTCLLFRARRAQRPRQAETWLLTDHQVLSMKQKSHDSLKRLLNRWGVCELFFFGGVEGGCLVWVCVCVCVCVFWGIWGLMCVWERGSAHWCMSGVYVNAAFSTALLLTPPTDHTHGQL